MTDFSSHPRASYPALPTIQHEDIAGLVQAYERIKETLETLTRQNKRNEQSALTVGDLPKISAGVMKYYNTLTVGGPSQAPLFPAWKIPFNPVASGLSSNNVQAAIDELAYLSTVANEPTGFPDTVSSLISFDEPTRTFTIEPNTGGGSATFDYFLSGRRHTVSVAQDVVWSDTQGLHFFYFDRDGSGLKVTQTFTPELIEQHALVAYVYWSVAAAASVRRGDERHGLVMDGLTHEHFHLTIGCQWISGLFPTNMVVDGSGALDAHCEFGVTDGVIRDEDLSWYITDGSPQVLQAVAQLPVLYKDGALGNWLAKTADNFPVIYDGTAGYSGTTIAYNEWTGATWQLTAAGNNKCILIHLWATNDIAEPVFVILGENVYDTVVTAQEAANSEINALVTAGLPTPEFTPLATFIVQTSTTYSNTPGARLRSTADGADYIGWHGTPVSPSSGVATGDHGNLAGLADDDHPQYAEIANAETISAVWTFTNHNRISHAAPRLSFIDTDAAADEKNTMVISSSGLRFRFYDDAWSSYNDVLALIRSSGYAPVKLSSSALVGVSAHDTYDLGESSYRFKNAYIERDAYVGDYLYGGGFGADNKAFDFSLTDLQINPDSDYASVDMYGNLHLTGWPFIHSTAPRIYFNDTDAGTDEKNWYFNAAGSAVTLYAIDDAYASATQAWAVYRGSGTTILNMQFFCPTYHRDDIEARFGSSGQGRINYESATGRFVIEHIAAAGLIDFRVYYSSKMQIDSNGHIGINGQAAGATYELDAGTGDTSMRFIGNVHDTEASGSVADDGTYAFSTVAISSTGRTLCVIVATKDVNAQAIFFCGTTAQLDIGSGANISFGGSSNPDVDGDLNIWVTGGAVNIKNRLGAAYSFRLTTMTPI